MIVSHELLILFFVVLLATAVAWVATERRR